MKRTVMIGAVAGLAMVPLLIAQTRSFEKFTVEVPGLANAVAVTAKLSQRDFTMRVTPPVYLPGASDASVRIIKPARRSSTIACAKFIFAPWQTSLNRSLLRIRRRRPGPRTNWNLVISSSVGTTR